VALGVVFTVETRLSASALESSAAHVKNSHFCDAQAKIQI